METRPKTPVGTLALLAVAALLYCGMLVSLTGLNETDATGRGMALGFGAIFGVALWLVLAVLLLIAAINGEMSFAGRTGAAIFLPLSAIAASVAINLYGDRADWALVVPVLLPPVIAAFVLWVRVPDLHDRLPAVPTMLVLGAIVAVLTLTPLLVSLLAVLPDSERDARQVLVEKAKEDKLREEEKEALRQEAEAFARLGPESSLGDYLQYLPGGDTRSHEALDGARKVKSREKDAIDLLNSGRLDGLTDLFRLDLQPAPALCKAYDEALSVEAERVTKARSDYLSIAIDLEQQLPNIKWLVTGGCNLNASLGILADHVRAVSDSQRMDNFAVRLEALRR